MKRMIIANRLADGAVVFLAPNHEWTRSIDEGSVMADETEAAQGLEVAQRHESECLVIEPMLIEVAIEDGRPRPTAIREAIRAFGPTIRTDLASGGVQAVEAWRQ